MKTTQSVLDLETGLVGELNRLIEDVEEAYRDIANCYMTVEEGTEPARIVIEDRLQYVQSGIAELASSIDWYKRQTLDAKVAELESNEEYKEMLRDAQQGEMEADHIAMINIKEIV